MTTGVVFAAEISQSVAEILYTPGANVIGVCNVNMLNKGTEIATKVRLGYCASATTVAAWYIERGLTLAPGEVLERTGIVVSGTQTLIAECETTSGIQVIVWSVEDTL